MDLGGQVRVGPSAGDGESGVWRVLLDRDDARNALNTAIADSLSATIDEVVAAGGKLIVLEAAGSVFSAGADLKELASGASERAIQAVAESPVPWFAVVRGPAIGAGAALVAVCAFSVLGPGAWMSLPEVATIGRFPVGISAWLERFSGMRPLLDLAITGRRVRPSDAVEQGWAGAYAADLDAAASDRLAELAALPPEVLAQAQDSWRRWLGTTLRREVSA